MHVQIRMHSHGFENNVREILSCFVSLIPHVPLEMKGSNVFALLLLLPRCLSCFGSIGKSLNDIQVQRRRNYRVFIGCWSLENFVVMWHLVTSALYSKPFLTSANGLSSFLDSNYSYSFKKEHGTKILIWKWWNLSCCQ